MPLPVMGSILDWPIDKRIRRSGYTDSKDGKSFIQIQQQTAPTVSKKPKLGDHDLMKVLQQVLQKQDQSSQKMIKSMPSNLDARAG